MAERRLGVESTSWPHDPDWRRPAINVHSTSVFLMADGELIRPAASSSAIGAHLHAVSGILNPVFRKWPPGAVERVPPSLLE
jgi:hypothetical protein